MDYVKALELATYWHKDQKYGDKSYLEGHLLPCVALAEQYHEEFDYFENLKFPKNYWGLHDQLMQVLLHDILEDTKIGWYKLQYEVGYTNAFSVYCVTDGAGKNRKERKLAVYQAIRKAGTYSPLFVKLIDRLHNVSSGEKRDMYRKEHYAFKCALDDGSFPTLWKAIEDKLDWSF
jgi:(p)ppGpp synthase/HD superfamily hydrolase